MNIVPHSVGCLFTFLMLSFEAQTFFILMKSNYAFFSGYAFGVIDKQPLPSVRSRRFIPLFSSKNSTVIAIILRSCAPFQVAGLFCVVVKNNLWLGLLKVYNG